MRREPADPVRARNAECGEHDEESGSYLAVRAGRRLLRGGSFVEQGESGALFEHPTDQYVRELAEAVPHIADR